jgi:hypothetical protein
MNSFLSCLSIFKNKLVFVCAESKKDILKLIKSNPDPFFTIGYSRYEKLNDNQIQKLSTSIIKKGIPIENVYSSILFYLQNMEQKNFINFLKSN